MISTFHSIVLGIVQGLTEFLPVSSSAHLVIVPWLLKWHDDPGLAFDVALHLGTLLALLVYYWREWLDMGLSLASGKELPRRLLYLLVVASVPGGIIGVLFEKEAETLFRTPILIAAATAILGSVLWAADKTGRNERAIEDITVLDAIVIGLSQAAAVIPGVSRSGATITAARFLGLDREAAANFSFLMAAPIIAGAGMWEGRKILQAGIGPQVGWGFAAAAVFGVLAIYSLLTYVRTRTYRPFAIYRLALAAIIVAAAMARGA